jgi:Skp family chaperone for outer membrane proteins
MKKVLFSLLITAGFLFSANTVNAQTKPIKIGYFDIEQMVMAMPGYRSVDSLLQIYQADSLNTEYNIYLSEYHRLDSTFKADSAAGKSKAVLDYSAQQRQQVGMNLYYWQQISQNKLENKRAQLAQPLFEQVMAAYKKVLDANKYTLILKPEALEQGTALTSAAGGADNIFELVAKELKITLPGAANGNGQPEEPAPAEQQPAKPSGSSANKPK